MTELIQVIQKHDPGSALVELYELEVDDTLTVYFHPGLDNNLTEIQFDGNTYVALPAELTGVEYASDGASNRPSITIANLLGTFSGFLYDFWASPAIELRNEDLIGRRITKRATLYKYLDGQPGSSSPVIEFPKRRYIIDRISQETKSSVTFELAAPFDLSGVELPGRNIVGKYCGWRYQGGAVDSGCMWRTNSVINYADGSEGVNPHKAYFTEDDEPIVPSGSSWSVGIAPTSYKTYTVWAGTATAGNYYEYDNTVWKCVKDTTFPPYSNSSSWVRGDVCGKKLSSCKCRFQFKPEVQASSNQLPLTDGSGNLVLDTTKVLPFGAFPGSRKFR